MPRASVQRSDTANSVSGPAPWLAGLQTSTLRGHAKAGAARWLRVAPAGAGRGNGPLAVPSR
jgi:hypothetical protein